MRIVKEPFTHGLQMEAWWRVFESDGSNAAYCADAETARQVALVPELVDALRKIEKDCRGFDNYSPRGIYWEIAANVLAKMEGGQQG